MVSHMEPNSEILATNLLQFLKIYLL